MQSSNNRKSFSSIKSHKRKIFLESRKSSILDNNLNFDNIAENRNLSDSELIQRADLHMDVESIAKQEELIEPESRSLWLKQGEQEY